MGYFDSPKNRALWDIELKELKGRDAFAPDTDVQTVLAL